MRNLFHQAPWCIESLICFGSSFDCSGFTSPGSFRDNISCNLTGWIFFSIQQGGNDIKRDNSETRLINTHFDLPKQLLSVNIPRNPETNIIATVFFTFAIGSTKLGYRGGSPVRTLDRMRIARPCAQRVYLCLLSVRRYQ